MSTTPIKVGLIGVNPHRGWASFCHIPALQAVSDYEIRAVSTRPDLVEDVKKTYDFPLVFTDSEEMINHRDVELVVVAVRVPLHRDLVTAALSAGKHVYSEWPLGVELDQAVEMAEHARRAGVHTVVGLQNRVTPAINHVREMVASGELGEVLSTTMNVAAMSGNQIDVGNAYLADIDNGANMLSIALGQSGDALNHTLGEWRELSAVLANRIPELTVIETGESLAKTSHDQAAVIGTLHSGATASLHVRSTGAHEDSFHWEINGSRGHLVITAPGGSPGMFPLTVNYRAKGSDAPQELPIALPQIGDIPVGMPANNVALLYQWLSRDLREDSRTVPNFDDAVIRHRMLTAILKAEKTGDRQTYDAGAAVTVTESVGLVDCA